MSAHSFAFGTTTVTDSDNSRLITLEVKPTPDFADFEGFEKLYTTVMDASMQESKKVRLMVESSGLVSSVPLWICMRIVNLIMATRTQSKHCLEATSIVTDSMVGKAALNCIFSLVPPSAPIVVFACPRKAVSFHESTEKLPRKGIFYR